MKKEMNQNSKIYSKISIKEQIEKIIKQQHRIVEILKSSNFSFSSLNEKHRIQKIFKQIKKDNFILLESIRKPKNKDINE